MKRYILFSFALAVTAFFSGCTRQGGDGPSNGGRAELAFTVSGMSLFRATDEPLPEGIHLRITVFAKNDDPSTAAPIAQGAYRVSGNAGAAVPIKETDRIELRSGDYDFYILSPDLAPSGGKVRALSGQDVMTSGKLSVSVAPGSDGKCRINVPLTRRSAMLDVVIYYETDGLISSAAIRADDSLAVSGLASAADVPLDGSAFACTGTDYTALFPADSFVAVTAPEGTGTAGISTFTAGEHRGIPVLPSTAGLDIQIPMTFNAGIRRDFRVAVPGAVLEQGKYYTLKLKVSIRGTIVATITQWIPSEGNGEQETGTPPIDYSLQPANCYITSADKPILFDATKKPRVNGGDISAPTTCTNILTDPRDKALSDDLDKSDIDRIAVVWQTAANHGKITGRDILKPAEYTAADMVVQDVSYDPYTGFCTVEPHPTGGGNALIAAYDATGNILWNWHIWVTEGTVQANVPPGNTANGAGNNFMDRNLGALAATTTKPTAENAYKYFGTFYQWGRKEPSTGQGPSLTKSYAVSIYDKDGKLIISPKETEIPRKGDRSGFYFQSSAAQCMVQCIQNALLFYNGDDTGKILPGNPSTWSDYGTPKSLYDPCPYGYRTPKGSSSGSNGANSSWSNWGTTHNQQWISGEINGGLVMRASWWPAAEYRNTGAYFTYSDTGYYWSSSPSTYYPEESFNMQFNYNGTISYPGQSKSVALAMRCVRE